MLNLDKEDFDSLFYDCDQQRIMNLCQSKTYFDNNSFIFIKTQIDITALALPGMDDTIPGYIPCYFKRAS